MRRVITIYYLSDSTSTDLLSQSSLVSIVLSLQFLQTYECECPVLCSNILGSCMFKTAVKCEVSLTVHYIEGPLPCIRSSPFAMH